MKLYFLSNTRIIWFLKCFPVVWVSQLLLYVIE